MKLSSETAECYEKKNAFLILPQIRAQGGAFSGEVTVSFVQEIRSESPESHEKTSVSCHCERSEAISWPIGGLLRRLRRLAM
jgi:hypothetical protein